MKVIIQTDDFEKNAKFFFGAAIKINNYKKNCLQHRLDKKGERHFILEKDFGTNTVYIIWHTYNAIYCEIE